VLGTLLLVHLRARARSGAACSASVALLCAGVDWVGRRRAFCIDRSSIVDDSIAA
jgi:hypothetical protein